MFSGKPICRGLSVGFNGDFFDFSTTSGYRSPTHQDPKGLRIQMPENVSNGDLGGAIIEGLRCSRYIVNRRGGDVWVDPEAEVDPDVFNYRKMTQRHDEWVALVMGRFGYKTRKALMKNMKICWVRYTEGLITLYPTRHCALEAWEGVGEEGGEIIHVDVPLDAIGAAVRRVLSQCL